MKALNDPVDIASYEIALTDFMKAVDGFGDSYEEYAKRRRDDSGFGEPRRASAQSLGGDHPILMQIFNTREAINEYFQTGKMPINDQVQDTVTIGRALSELEAVPIVNPDGKVLEHGISDKFATRLWEEDDYWDTVFELETASALIQAGFSPALVEEGNQTGPDVLVEDNGNDVWIECKRKRPKPESEREQESEIIETIDQVFKKADLGEDSFAIEVRGPRTLAEGDSAEIVDTAEKLLQSGNPDTRTITLGSSEFEVELVDYYNGRYITDLTPEWIEAIQPYIEISNAVNPFGHLDYSIDPESSYGHAEAQFKISDDGKLSVVNGVMFGVRCSSDIDYVSWVMEPIKQARKKVSGNPPSVILVDVPHQKIDQMNEESTTDHNGQTVTKLERLEQRIIGQLSDSDTISAIVLTSRLNKQLSNGFQQGRFAKAFVNHNPEIPVSGELESFLRGN